MNGSPHSDATYINALRTNEDDNPSTQIIKNFAQQLSAANPANIQSVISESMDITEIISFIVVDRMIRNDDGPFHWYCGSSLCSNHNYYWYEEPTNKKLHLIPWDLDNAFENIMGNANPVTPIADEFGKVRNDCQPFTYGDFDIRQWSASCDKLTAGWASYTQEFAQIKSQFKEGPFSKTQANALIDGWVMQIRDATIEAANTNEDAISVAEWESALQVFINQLEFARYN